MKRCLLLVLTLLLLAGCGKDLPAVEEMTGGATAVVTATEAESTTEEPTTSFVLMSGESNGVTWRTLDLADPLNRDIEDWLEGEKVRSIEEYEKLEKLKKPKEHRLNDQQSIVIVEGDEGRGNDVIETVSQILLRDNKTGNQTVLLEGNGIAGDQIKWPVFREIIDERFFLFQWGVWEWGDDALFYDTVEKKELKFPFKRADDWSMPWLTEQRGNLFYFEEHGDEEDYSGQLRFWEMDVSYLPQMEPIDLLDGFAGEPVKEKHDSLFTKDGRYYIVVDSEELRIYDLRKKTMLFSLPKVETDIFIDEYHYLDHFFLRNEQILYLCSPNFAESVKNKSLMVEIKLP